MQPLLVKDEYLVHRNLTCTRWRAGGESVWSRAYWRLFGQVQVFGILRDEIHIVLHLAECLSFAFAPSFAPPFAPLSALLCVVGTPFPLLRSGWTRLVRLHIFFVFVSALALAFFAFLIFILVMTALRSPFLLLPVFTRPNPPLRPRGESALLFASFTLTAP